MDGLKDTGVPRIYFLKGSAPYLDLVTHAGRGVPRPGLDPGPGPGHAAMRGLRGAGQPGSAGALRHRRSRSGAARWRSAEPATQAPGHVFNLGHGIRRRRPSPPSRPWSRPSRASAGIDRQERTMAVPIRRNSSRSTTRPGPRYTSYPTVPAWKQAVRRGRVPRGPGRAGRAAGRRAGHLPAPALLRQALPLLRLQRAGHPTRRTTWTRYLDRLERELGRGRRPDRHGRRVVQMHWGGGTPNYLRTTQIERRWPCSAAPFAIAPEAEISLEIDPRIGSARAGALPARGWASTASAWACRTSSQRVQKAIGRRQSRERDPERLPGLPRRRFRGRQPGPGLRPAAPDPRRRSPSTLREIIDLAPDRVACFSYAHVPWVRPNQDAGRHHAHAHGLRASSRCSS